MRPNIQITGIQKGENRENSGVEIIKEIIHEHFS